MRHASYIKSCLFLFLALLSPMILTSLSHAYVCGMDELEGMTLRGEPDPPDGTTWEDVLVFDPGVYGTNTAFPAVFTIKICWTLDSQGQSSGWEWGSAEISDFADRILNNAPDSRHGYDLARDICDYFGRNEDDTNHASIKIRRDNTGIPSEDLLTHYTIYIYNDDRHIFAGIDRLTVHIYDNGSTALSPQTTAEFAFAHEWQHIVHQYYNRNIDNSVTTNSFNSFNELASKLSEYKFGGGRSSDDRYDFIYDRSLMGNDSYYEDCYFNYIDSEDICKVAFHGNHYYEWAHLATYLDNAFTGTILHTEDLFYKWLHDCTIEAPDDTLYHHDFAGLAVQLGALPPYADAYFTESGSRYQELLHKYSMAKYLNYTNPVASDKLYQWHEPNGSTPVRPQDLYGLFTDRNGECYNNIKTLPIYNQVDADFIFNDGGWQCSADVWPGSGSQGECPADCGSDTHAAFHKYRYVQLSEFASNYLVFLADPSSSGQLLVSILPEAAYSCMKCDESASEGYTLKSYGIDDFSGVTLYYDVVGYKDLSTTPDELTNPLDILGDDAEIISNGEWSDISGDGALDITVDDFGMDTTEYNAIVIVLSMYPDTPPVGIMPPKTLPYRYSYAVMPDNPTYHSGTITQNETWASNSIKWINGPVNVSNNAILTIESGAQVFFATTNACLNIFGGGGLTINGTEENPCIFRISPLHNSIDCWAGITHTGSGDLDIEGVQFRQISGFSKGADGSLSLSDCKFYFTDSGSNEVTLYSSSSTNGSTVADVDFMEIKILVAQNASFTDCRMDQDEDVRSQFTDHALCYFTKGVNSMTSCDLRFVDLGIDVRSTSLVDTELNLYGPGMKLYGIDPDTDESSLAILCAEGGDLDADNVLIGDVHIGVEVDDGRLFFRNSSWRYRSQGLKVRGRNAIVNLGTTINPPAKMFNSIEPTESFCEDPDGTTLSCDPAIREGESEPPRINYLGGSHYCYAQYNYWGSCMCADAYFIGKTNMILWTPYNEPVCCTSKPPLFSLGASANLPSATEVSIYPNPANRTVQIRYAGGRSEESIHVDIYSIAGRRIRTIKQQGSGTQHFTWDGKDNRGIPVANGIYFVRVQSESVRHTEKVVLLR